MSRELEMLRKYPHCHLDNERCVSLLVEVDALKAQMQQARADALGEAACVVKANLRARDGREVICDAILALIDQSQEDVCEWSRPKGWSGMYDTGCGYLLDYEDAFKFCPYCGKLINVKEQL